MSMTRRETEKSMRAAEGLVDLLSIPMVAATLLGIVAVAVAVLA